MGVETTVWVVVTVGVWAVTVSVAVAVVRDGALGEVVVFARAVVVERVGRVDVWAAVVRVAVLVVGPVLGAAGACGCLSGAAPTVVVRTIGRCSVVGAVAAVPASARATTRLNRPAGGGVTSTCWVSVARGGVTVTVVVVVVVGGGAALWRRRELGVVPATVSVTIVGRERLAPNAGWVAWAPFAVVNPEVGGAAGVVDVGGVVVGGVD
jgi:hypothetical protein